MFSKQAEGSLWTSPDVRYVAKIAATIDDKMKATKWNRGNI